MKKVNKSTEDIETKDQAHEADEAEDRDLAVEAYGLFCKGQSEGDFPAWEELPEATQKLWREGYDHVDGGGKPRTDYEYAVKYLILSAQ
jgi:hypothetical protein